MGGTGWCIHLGGRSTYLRYKSESTYVVAYGTAVKLKQR